MSKVKGIMVHIEVNGKPDFYSYLTEEGYFHTYASTGRPTIIAMYDKETCLSTTKVDFSEITKVTLMPMGIEMDKNGLLKGVK